jgi:hypothetical protein
MCVNIESEVMALNLVLDRFEGQYAVCEEMETQKTVAFAMEDLPPGAAAGDVLAVEGGHIFVDAAATRERRERIQKLFEKLFAQD